jgi:23S rRNA (cytidine1920-2'-O)/16S rRNA (cytidine1409-2'-O)-methyltransferase
MDRTNARTLDAESLPEKVDLVVIDASFIGMEKLLPAAHEVLREEGFLVAMIKPQFEVGKANLKKGVVRDLVVRKAAIERVTEGARSVGFEIRGVDDSVLPGPDGNVEAFMFAQRVKREA